MAIYAPLMMKNKFQIILLSVLAMLCTSCATDIGGGADIGTFAGGTGTASHPYRVRTISHMQNMKNFPSAHFKLIADIDMDGVNWTPFELSGNFDGDNHTLYNLKISPDVTTDGLGLFSWLTSSASVKNLTINGFEVNAPSHSHIGAVASSSDGVISNCHVILIQENAIVGDSYIGGIVGKTGEDVINCSVLSNLSASVIAGNVFVGGIAGYADGMNGQISKIEACKTDVIISGTNGRHSAGGIVGLAEDFSIIACYSQGSIQGFQTYVGGIAGSGDYSPIRHCLTLMDLDIVAYSYSLDVDNTSFSSKDLANQYSNPINVAEIMRAANSEYASYWDYDNTWTWAGTIGRKSVIAICPKLTWEQ